MKIIRIVLAALICLPISALAVPDSVITGPYNITFDLGHPKEAYKIEIKQPESSETLGGEASETYSFTVLLNNTTPPSLLTLNILDQKQTVVPSKRRVYLNIKEIEALGLSGVQGAARQIDGKDGVVCSGFDLLNGKMHTTYFADYYLSKNEKVFVYSDIPWDEGTLSLLKTIHIEKSNATT